VQVLQTQEKHKKKKLNQDAITKWRKSARQKGEEFPVELLESDSKSPKKNQGVSENPRKRKADDQKGRTFSKKQMKDEKYGFGGRKKGSKKNDAESMREGNFSIKKNKVLDKDLKKFKNKHKGFNKPASRKPNRPGKRARQNKK